MQRGHLGKLVLYLAAANPQDREQRWLRFVAVLATCTPRASWIDDEISELRRLSAALSERFSDVRPIAVTFEADEPAFHFGATLSAPGYEDLSADIIKSISSRAAVQASRESSRLA
jgi:hypothetical protein